MDLFKPETGNLLSPSSTEWINNFLEKVKLMKVGSAFSVQSNLPTIWHSGCLAIGPLPDLISDTLNEILQSLILYRM